MCVSEALIKRVPPLIRLEDWAKNSEVRDLYGFFLLLYHVSNAFCNAAPDHVKETQGLALAHFEGISCEGVLWNLLGACRLNWSSWVSNEGEIELRQVAIEEAWIVNTFFEKSELRVRLGLHYAGWRTKQSKGAAFDSLKLIL